MKARRILIYSLEQGRSAVAAAAEYKTPIILMSAPGMAGFMGPLWFKALTDQAAAGHPEADVTALLDCVDEPGAVLGSLRCGFKLVRFTGAERTRARLDEIARQYGAVVEGHREVPTLDLLDCKDPLASCRAFLAPD